VTGQTQIFNVECAAQPVPDCTIQITVHQIAVHFSPAPYSPKILSSNYLHNQKYMLKHCENGYKNTESFSLA